MQIPYPQRGQPIDVNYLYQIAKQVNTLTSQISNTSTVLSSVDNGEVGRKDSRTNNLHFFATTINIKKGSVTASTTEPWTVTFSPNFLYKPIVVATVVNKNNSTAGNNIIVSVKDVSTNTATGNILFNTAGSIDVNVNVIAIGTTS